MEYLIHLHIRTHIIDLLLIIPIAIILYVFLELLFDN